MSGPANCMPGWDLSRNLHDFPARKEMKVPVTDRQDSKSRKLKKMMECDLAPLIPGTKVRCTPVSALCNLVPRATPKSRLAWLTISVLCVMAVLQICSFLTGVHPLQQVSMLSVKVSYLIGREWRYMVGIYSPNYTYPGRIPPYSPDSSQCVSSFPLPTGKLLAVESADGFSSNDVDYDVCLVLSIGDDGDVPNDRAVPYPLVSRLTDALKEEVEGVRRDGRIEPGEKVHVLVGVDHGSIVCAMVRDMFYEDFGVRAHCTDFSDLEQGLKCGKLVSGESKRFVPQVPEVWIEAVEWDRSRSVDLDCAEPSHQAPAIPQKDWQPTIVTGFSGNHMTVGLLLLRSIGKAAKEGRGLFNVSVVVWAMEIFDRDQQGLVDCVMDELNYEYGVKAEMRIFDWAAHPSWMRINHDLGYFGGTGEYAWKGIMVHTILRERGFVLWADAGDRFHDTESLITTLKVLNSTGFVSRNSHGFVYTRTHPRALKYYRANLPGIWDLENCEAAIVGFTLKKYDELARPWYDCSITRQCIAPDGSDRSNHRQDQSALTLLSILSKNPCRGAHPHFSDHLDDDPALRDVSGAYLTKCYVDPLVLGRQGTYKPVNRPHGIIN